MWYVVHNDTLAHHGILGQKWGKRNGPPYPLGAGDYSASERNTGWRKSLDKGGGDSYNKKRKANTASGHTGRPGGNKTDKPKRGLTTGQKRAIAIGAAAVAAGLAAYGGYKLYQSGKLDPMLARFAKKGELLAGELPESGTVIPFANKEPVGSGLKRLAKPESLDETIRNANPNLDNPLYENNCAYCGVAAILRRQGFDVAAKDTGRKMMNLLGVVEDCCEEGSYQKREHFSRETLALLTRAPSDTERKLTGWFGSDAAGCISVGLKGGGGHVFNWATKDGKVTFYDPQKQQGDAVVREYWKLMDSARDIQVVRLDKAVFKEDKIKSVVY